MTNSNLEQIEPETDVIKKHNFIISHNRVLFVQKITSKDIKNGGKYAVGDNYQTGETVQILDKDYGKSPELMRTLLEGSNIVPLWRKILILGLGFFIIGIMLIVVFSNLPTKDKTPVKIETPIIRTDVLDAVNGKINVEKTPVKIETPIIRTGPLESVNINNSNLEILKKDFELEKAIAETQKIIEEKNVLTHDNFNLTTIIDEKDLIIKDLQNKLAEYTEKSQNITQDAFLLHLGLLVFDGCEKAEKEGDKNKCKDLYFKFIQND